MANGMVVADSYAYVPRPVGQAGLSALGGCTLSFAGNVLLFRTNPNEIWWSYELLKNVEYTYGGQVVQILGTRLGDLRVKIDCGGGGWPYLVRVATFLRDLLTYQRGGNTATFEYVPRNWRLSVYGMTIPFKDQLTATVRELEISFKVQQDISGVLSQATIAAEILRLNEGTYTPGVLPHNQFDDQAGVAGNLSALSGGMIGALSGDTLADPQTPSGPLYTGSGITNSVDDDPEGDFTDLAGSVPGAGLLSDALQQAGIPNISVPGVGQIPIGDG